MTKKQLEQQLEQLKKSDAVVSIIEQLELIEDRWRRLFDNREKDPEFYPLEDNNERTVYLKMGEMRKLYSLVKEKDK